MPKKLEEIVRALKREGYSDKKAWAIGTAQYKKLQRKKRGKKK